MDLNHLCAEVRHKLDGFRSRLRTETDGANRFYPESETMITRATAIPTIRMKRNTIALLSIMGSARVRASKS
jgi:hypothetical protein